MNDTILYHIESALSFLHRAEKGLQAGRGLGFLDMFGGRGITSLLKHGALEYVRRDLESARFHMLALGTAAPEIEIGGLLTVFDLFADNFFSDLMVQNRINDALEQVRQAIYELEALKLREM